MRCRIRPESGRNCVESGVWSSVHKSFSPSSKVLRLLASIHTSSVGAVLLVNSHHARMVNSDKNSSFFSQSEARESEHSQQCESVTESSAHFEQCEALSLVRRARKKILTDNFWSRGGERVTTKKRKQSTLASTEARTSH